MGFMSFLINWFADKVGFFGLKTSLKRKTDEFETLNNKRARMENSLVKLEGVSDEYISEAEEMERTDKPSHSRIVSSKTFGIFGNTSSYLWIPDSVKFEDSEKSPAAEVSISGKNEQNSDEYISEAEEMESTDRPSHSRIVSGKTFGIFGNASSNLWISDSVKFEDSEKSPAAEGTVSSNVEDNISTLNFSNNNLIDNNKDNSYTRVLKYIGPKSKTVVSNCSDTIGRSKSLSDISMNNNTNNSFLNKSQSLSCSDDQEILQSQSNLPQTLDKETINTRDLNSNSFKVKRNEIFDDPVLKRFKKDESTTDLNPVSSAQKSPDNIFQEKSENMEKIQPLKEKDVFPEYSEKIDRIIVDRIIGSPKDYVFKGKNIRKSDLLSMFLPDGWVTDEVINHYLNLIVDRDPMNIFVFDTFFFNKLSCDGYESVRRWSRGKDIFSYKKMFCPIHLGTHWSLICVNFTNKIVTYYDSLGRVFLRCLRLIFCYLGKELLDKKNLTLVPSEWQSLHSTDCPKQETDDDCGVFVCTIAEYLARDATLDFTQDDIPMLRTKICYEILSQKLCH